MSKPDTWMPWYIGDYLADTMHLRAAEHGAYLMLIAAYWRNGAALNDFDSALAAVARCTAAEWKRMRPTIAAFFDVREGKWHHKRIDAELSAASEKKVKAQAAAHKRWHSGRNADASPEHMPKPCPSPSPSPLIDDDEARARDPGREVLEAIGVWGDARWFGNGSLVAAWMAAGADLDLDILPTVKAVMAKRGSQDPPSSLKYFDRAVMDAHATRTTPAKQGKPNGNAGNSNRKDQTALRRAGLAGAFDDESAGGTAAD